MALKDIRKTRLRQAKAHFTQKGVAKALGVSEATYNRYEKHPETLTIKKQKELARILGVAPEQIK